MSTRTAERAVSFGERKLVYSVQRQDRSDLAITVHPDLTVSVKAPLGRAAFEIDAKVKSKGAWIMRQQLRFETLHPIPAPKRYVPGETFRYLGRQHRLRASQGDTARVVLRRPFLVVECPTPGDSRAVGRLVEGWYRSRADAMLPRYLEQARTKVPALRHQNLTLRIRRMSRRWGSCTAKGVITVNPDLMRASPSCIEYVIVHELCHCLVLSHGPRFERLILRVMPDWRERRKRLNQC